MGGRGVEDMEIGQTAKVLQDEPVPADLVFLTTGEESGECYLDTADLDRETNLKRKTTEADIFKQVKKDNLVKSVQDLKGDITFEFPNTNLESFRGSVEYKGEQQNIPLNHKNILLRGCTLRNTAFVVGIMVYAGHDTKIMKNTGAGRMKRTHLDFQLDWLVMEVRCRTCFVGQTAHMLVCAAGRNVAPGRRKRLYPPPPPSHVQYWAVLPCRCSASFSRALPSVPSTATSGWKTTAR